MTIVLSWGIAVGFVQDLCAQDAQFSQFLSDSDPIPAGVFTGPFVRLPYITSTPAHDPARDVFWETTVQSQAVDLSRVIVSLRAGMDDDAAFESDDDVPPLYRGIAASKPMIVKADELLAKRGSEYSRAKGLGTSSRQVIGSVEPWEWQVAGSDLAAASARADDTVRSALAMADKGALYAAREEFESALRTIAQALDLHFQTRSHGEALSEGLLAMHEAGDFLPSSEHADMTLDVAAIAVKHRSKALEGVDLLQLDSLGAAQLHFAYAQQELVASLGNSPAASRSLFGLGKFCMLRAEQSPTSTQANNARAMAFHYSAILVDRTNVVAGNELGVLLARQGRLFEARDVLRQSIAVSATPDTWRNLATVHERLGEFDNAQRSRVECQRATELARNMNPGRITASSGTSVHWVDTKTFERGNMQRTAADPPPHLPSQPMFTRRPVQGIPWIR